jgi:hypothetical protein
MEVARMSDTSLSHDAPYTLTAPYSLTGRDGVILTQALPYAIVTIDRLPRDRQERSNREDMWDLLTALVGAGDRERLLKDVRLQMAAPMHLAPRTTTDDDGGAA